VFDEDRFRSVMGHFATGVTVVTGQGPGGPAGMTVNAVCSVSLDPALVLVCFDNSARTLPVVRERGRFAVNVLTREQRELARRFATKEPEEEKFAGVEFELRGGVPVLAGALAWVVCSLRELIAAGDHTIGIGAVEDLRHDSEREPLVWYRGEYRTIEPGSPHLGRAPQ
jgi:3-hydroxy-9,10-secoandrosta-1,3,5(10)-triene-9,17-dione monooxygenase reductase component